MRKLGLNASSAGAIRIVRRDVERLGLDTSHFRGKRIWTDSQLRRAVMDSLSWDELLGTLGLAPGSGDGRIRVKAHAMRLGLDLSHLESPAGNLVGVAEAKPDLRYLRDAATSLAAAWFSLCGFSVAIPTEPAVYDLLVVMPEGIRRVQVKTTTCYSKDGWTVVVGRRPYSVGNREQRIPYDPESIDLFFIVDGDLTIYLISSRIIAGRVAILLRTYTRYIVGSAAGLMTASTAVA
jgi:PD-(D/E)XK endonuclease